MTEAANMEYIKLYNGVEMPMLGFGVFQIPDHEEAKRAVLAAPMVNQAEMHPFFQQGKNLETMKEYGVVPEAWAPFDEGLRNIFLGPVLTGIGKKYGKSAAQVALRWNLQRGVVVIPKSVHEERIRENSDVFDFTLSEDDMKAIAAMDIGHSEIVDHFDPHWIRMLHNYKF